MPGGNLWYELLEPRSRSSKGLDQDKALRSLLQTLSPEERDRILSDQFESDCLREFRKFDEDGNGRLDGEELCMATVGCLSVAFARRIGRGAKLRRLALAFDSDGDGLINESEFVTFVRFCMALEVRDYFTRSCLYKSVGVWAVGSGGGDFGLPAGGLEDVFEPALPSDEAIVQVAVGDAHMLALQDDGDVFAWGSNEDGQIGIGDIEVQVVDRPQPVPVRVVISMIAAGENYSAFLDRVGWCWTFGANDCGQLGLGDTAPRREPELVSSIRECSVVIDCSLHTLVVTAAGNVWAWGANDCGQLGVGVQTQGSEEPEPGKPRQFETLPMKLEPQARGARFARAGAAGRLNPQTGQEFHAEPVMDDIVGVACGGHHSLALSSDGRLFTWGQASQGQLGLGGEFTDDQSVPCLVGGAFGHDFYVCHVAAGASHSACISMPLAGGVGSEKAASLIHGFGRNDFQQAVASSTRLLPVFLPTLPALEAEALTGRRKVSIACGADFTVCVTDDRRVWIWGRRLRGECAERPAQPMAWPSPTGSPSPADGIAGRAHEQGQEEELDGEALEEPEAFAGEVTSLQAEYQIGAIGAGGHSFVTWRAPLTEALPPEEQSKKTRARRNSKAKAKASSSRAGNRRRSR